MRKAFVIGGVVIVVAIALVTYAVLNLNKIIHDNRAYALDRLGKSLGRSVEVQGVSAALGWGVALDVTGLKIADDPAFSQLPIVQAAEVYAQAAFVPLLFGRLHLGRVMIKAPVVRIVRDSRGELNLSELGAKPASGKAEEAAPARERSSETAAKRAHGAGLLGALSISDFSLQKGKLSYRDLNAGGEPLGVTSIDLDVQHFSVSGRFDVSVKLATLDTDQNLAVSGKVGPLLRGGTLDIGAIPVDLEASVGPILLGRARQIEVTAGLIPQNLSISEGVEAKAKISGILDALKFEVNSDLSSSHVVYGGLLDKPSGVPLQLSALGARQKAGLAVEQAKLSLAGLELKAEHLGLGRGEVSARVDTNRFDLAPLGKVLPPTIKYHPSGAAEVHVDLKVQLPHLELSPLPPSPIGQRRGKMRVVGLRPAAEGTIALSQIAIKPEGGKFPAVKDLSGNIRLTGRGAIIEPTSFDLGSGHASLQAKADSLDPLQGSFQFSADAVNLAELVPSRQAESAEELRQLSVGGTLGGTLTAPQISADAASAAGSVANVAYQNLALAAVYGGNRLDLRSLRLNAFGGAIAGSALATMTGTRPFDAKLNLDNVDLGEALASQRAKAAGVVRGYLSGQVEVSGSGAMLEQIKPTLRGGGRATIRDGKLVGVNIVAQGLRQAQGIPGVGDLVGPDVIARHPELFSQPDTDIRQAGMTFTIEGPGITSHDIAVQSTDYRILGDGSFDMDKNIDLKSQVILSKPLSYELEARKKNVVYLTNRDGEVEIPLQIVGMLPKPKVLPDVQAMAQTAAKRALERQTGKILGGFLGKRNKGGLGGLLGGSAGSGTGSGPNPAPPNPLGPLEKLFH